MGNLGEIGLGQAKFAQCILQHPLCSNVDIVQCQIQTLPAAYTYGSPTEWKLSLGSGCANSPPRKTSKCFEHIVSISQPPKFPCLDNNIEAFAVQAMSAQLSGRTGPGVVKLQIRSLLHPGHPFLFWTRFKFPSCNSCIYNYYLLLCRNPNDVVQIVCPCPPKICGGYFVMSMIAHPGQNMFFGRDCAPETKWCALPRSYAAEWKRPASDCIYPQYTVNKDDSIGLQINP